MVSEPNENNWLRWDWSNKSETEWLVERSRRQWQNRNLIGLPYTLQEVHRMLDNLAKKMKDLYTRFLTTFLLQKILNPAQPNSIYFFYSFTPEVSQTSWYSSLSHHSHFPIGLRHVLWTSCRFYCAAHRTSIKQVPRQTTIDIAKRELN